MEPGPSAAGAKKKVEEFNHRKRLSWTDRENQMPPYLFIPSGSPLGERKGRQGEQSMHATPTFTVKML
jgi:hypothetical protein